MGTYLGIGEDGVDVVVRHCSSGSVGATGGGSIPHRRMQVNSEKHLESILLYGYTVERVGAVLPRIGLRYAKWRFLLIPAIFASGSDVRISGALQIYIDQQPNWFH